MDAKYPEHEKLKKVSNDSQAIGEFLDYGLPAQHLVLYQRYEEACECEQCRACDTHEESPTHGDADEIREGVAYYFRYRPTMKTIKTILADYFEIDQDKIEAEKSQMLAEARKANT